MTRRLWALANGIMLLLFLFAAVVQINDPDPTAWVAIYVVAAAICGWEIGRGTSAWAPLAVALIAIAWAGSLFHGARDVAVRSLFAEWEMRDIHIEEAREMYGLLIVAAWMVVIAIVCLARGKDVRRASR